MAINKILMVVCSLVLLTIGFGVSNPARAVAANEEEEMLLAGIPPYERLIVVHPDDNVIVSSDTGEVTVSKNVHGFPVEVIFENMSAFQKLTARGPAAVDLNNIQDAVGNDGKEGVMYLNMPILDYLKNTDKAPRASICGNRMVLAVVNTTDSALFLSFDDNSLNNSLAMTDASTVATSGDGNLVTINCPVYSSGNDCGHGYCQRHNYHTDADQSYTNENPGWVIPDPSSPGHTIRIIPGKCMISYRTVEGPTGKILAVCGCHI